MPFQFKKKGLRREIPKDLILRAIEEVSKGSKIKTTADKDQITIEVAEVVTPEIVRPYPKACPRKLIKNSRKKGKTRILTDTPEKRLIELAEQERQPRTRLKERGKKGS
ncbi:hypothetical protein EVAR_20481_1 [Eumeta japonica]|uniref:Uncharacterized protein n=1 Tax=Eumeta variegata TaxID=151549 RepID=A0A4C1Y944_EUMVA|nr:hypothetical protein EVAR_20481_1 [Eumeta japonica]